MAEEQAEFGAAGEHAVGFVDAERHEVVDEDADVALFAAEDEGRFAGDLERGVGAGHEALCACLFVAGGAVELAREVKARDAFGFERRLKLVGRAEIVFDRVAVAHDYRVFEARDQFEDLVLHVAREARADSVDVDFLRLAALGFEENLVRGLFGEADDFVFDRRAVARAAGFDLAGVHRGAMEVRADQFVHGLVRVGHVTGHLFDVERVVQIREGLGDFIAGLEVELAVVDRAGAEARGRAGFEAGDAEAEAFEGGGDARRGAFAAAPAGGLDFAGVHDGGEEGAGGDDDGAAAVGDVAADFHADDARALGRVFRQNVFDGFLAEVEVRLDLDEAFDFALVGPFVGLGAGRVHRRAFADVEHAELDAGAVDGEAHRAAEGVNFADDLALGDAADRRVTGHLADGIEVRREEGGLGADTGSGEGGLGPGVAGADYHDVVVIGENHASIVACGRESKRACFCKVIKMLKMITIRGKMFTRCSR